MAEAETATPQKAGICWIQEAQWLRLLDIAEDRDRLEPTWEEWRAKTEEMIEVFATRQIFIERVEVDVEDLLAWCNEKGKPVNASSRAEYVTAKMMAQKALPSAH